MVFKLIEDKQLNDIQSHGYLYEHTDTGAKVFYLKNEDKNKAFTIGFKTPPASNNGIAHILEHSVLNGSQKYPSKEPFVELIKGSLNTFVNAMTFSDKTIYPVASTNDKDFNNLVSVYLDAVFQPKMLEDSQILAQEGWHHHLEKTEDDLIYKGVVYNEMKGANASPERKLYNVISEYLFKGSIYQWDSGGDPAAIPTLNQKEFVNFHQRYYHPSNSYTVLYGDLDIDQYLAILADYFDKFDRQTTPVVLKAMPSGDLAKPVEETYSLAYGDEGKDKDYLSMTWFVAKPEEVLDGFGLLVLSDILFGNNQAPLRKALLDSGLGGDVLADFDEVGYPRLFNIVLKYSQADRFPAFKDLVLQTLEDLVQEGLDPDLIAASLNKISFQLKEAAMSESNPRGVIYAMEAYLTWLYDQSPYGLLEFNKYLSKLQNLSKQAYFEKLIQHKLLDNPHRLDVILRGQAGKNDQLEADRLAKLQEYKASLSEEEIQALVDQTQALIQRQESPDKPEDLAKIPSLSIEDLTTETEDLPLEISPLFDQTGDQTSLYYHAPQFTSGIDYVRIYLDLSDLPMEDFSSMRLLASLLGKMDTENLTASQLQTQIDLYTGGIAAFVQVFEDKDKTVKPYFVLTSKSLEASLDQALGLMEEIFTSKLDQAEEILKIVQKQISNFEQQINFSANALAANRALSQLSPTAKVAEAISGIDYFNFLKQVRDDLQAGQSEEILAKLQANLTLVLNRNRVNAFYIGEDQRAEFIRHKLQEVLGKLKLADRAPAQIYQPGDRVNEAFVTSQDVNYVAQASLTQDKLAYKGELEVLATLLRFDYLWNQIRVKGGAYGAAYSLKSNGDLIFSSYRDPNIAKTLETYQATPDFIQNLDLTPQELEKNIIGTMSNVERPLSASDKGIKAFALHQVGRTTADLLKIKEEIIASDLTKIKAYTEDFRQVLEDASLVVIGNKAMIDQDKDLFDSIQELY